MQNIVINPRELIAIFSAENNGKTTKDPENNNEIINNASEYVLYWLEARL
jgi:hypothetical protein